ncbi:uncharacterized protein LOC117171730 [Belonocnema kinseyi]|uniref:uncharacterized protein LOC117171730 n=1 Tax=Belonocnema kinseyi TaxID=2817044 RepID=UPI00143D4CDE|nr:uncharacterized protein LOC117171730 [Belonocnema kinseyi]
MSPKLLSIHRIVSNGAQKYSYLDDSKFLVMKGPSLVIGWYNEGVIAPLYDADNAVVAINVYSGRKIIMNDASQKLMGVGRRMPTPSFDARFGSGRHIYHGRHDSYSSSSDSSSFYNSPRNKFNPKRRNLGGFFGRCLGRCNSFS